MINADLKRILYHVKEKHGLDFTGYRVPMIERRVKKRFPFTKCMNYDNYFHYLHENPEELYNLIDILTINVSEFFRNPLTFEYIAGRILPAVINQKKATGNNSLRVWSAACSMGEEPYSTTILINELLQKEELKLDVNIFATDIDGKVLKREQKAIYKFESIKDVKYRLLEKYLKNYMGH